MLLMMQQQHQQLQQQQQLLQQQQLQPTREGLVSSLSNNTELVWHRRGIGMMGGIGDMYDPYIDESSDILPSWMQVGGYDDDDDEDYDDEDGITMLMAERHRPARLDASQIDALVETVDRSALAALADDELCPICLSCLNRSDEGDGMHHVVRIRRCTHAFCNTCLRKWLARSTVCPVCKADLSNSGQPPSAATPPINAAAPGNRRRRPDWSSSSSNASPPHQRRSITIVVTGVDDGEDDDAEEEEEEDAEGYADGGGRGGEGEDDDEEEVDEDEEEDEDCLDDEEHDPYYSPLSPLSF